MSDSLLVSVKAKNWMILAECACLKWYDLTEDTSERKGHTTPLSNFQLCCY